MALNITGQLTIGDGNNIGNTSNYARLDIDLFQVSIGSPGQSSTSEAIICRIAIWKSKPSYTNGKAPGIQSFGTQVTNEIPIQFVVDAATILTAPITNFNSLVGKSLYDKLLYWVHQQVAVQIIAANPTFTVSIVDINL